MNVLNHMPRFESICLPRAGTTAAPVDAAYRPIWAQDYRAASQHLRVVRVAHKNAGNIGDTAIGVNLYQHI
jgi:hypothetical protein